MTIHDTRAASSRRAGRGRHVRARPRGRPGRLCARAVDRAVPDGGVPLGQLPAGDRPIDRSSTEAIGASATHTHIYVHRDRDDRYVYCTVHLYTQVIASVLGLFYMLSFLYPVATFIKVRCDQGGAGKVGSRWGDGGATQCNAMQCNAMQCNAMQCNAMQWKGREVPRGMWGVGRERLAMTACSIRSSRVLLLAGERGVSVEGLVVHHSRLL